MQKIGLNDTSDFSFMKAIQFRLQLRNVIGTYFSMQISNYNSLSLYYRIVEFPVAHHANVMQIALIVELNSLRIFSFQIDSIMQKFHNNSVLHSTFGLVSK